MTTTKGTFEHEMENNKVILTDLPEKIQKKIEKYPSITDEDIRDDVDRAICDAIDELVESREKKKKIETSKAKHDERKKKIDVSGAATATNGKSKSEEKSFMDILFGRG